MTIIGTVDLPEIKEGTVVDTSHPRAIFHHCSDDIYVPCGDSLTINDPEFFDLVKTVELHNGFDRRKVFVERYMIRERNDFYPYIIKVHERDGSHPVTYVMPKSIESIKNSATGDYLRHESLLQAYIEAFIQFDDYIPDCTEVLSYIKEYLKMNKARFESLFVMEDPTVMHYIHEMEYYMHNPHHRKYCNEISERDLLPGIIDENTIDPLTKRSMHQPLTTDILGRWRTNNQAIVPMNVEDEIVTRDDSLVTTCCHGHDDALIELIEMSWKAPLTDISIIVEPTGTRNVYGFNRFNFRISKHTTNNIMNYINHTLCIMFEVLRFSKIHYVRNFYDQILIYCYIGDEISEVIRIDMALWMMCNREMVTW